jgi:hypothetical protein
VRAQQLAESVGLAVDEAVQVVVDGAHLSRPGQEIPDEEPGVDVLGL